MGLFGHKPEAFPEVLWALLFCTKQYVHLKQAGSWYQTTGFLLKTMKCAFIISHSNKHVTTEQKYDPLVI